MFKKKCKRCGKKISKNYDFCPYCGYTDKYEQQEKYQKNYGLLGKSDREDSLASFPQIPFGFGIKGFGDIFNSLLKQIDREFKELDKKMLSEKEKLLKNKKIKGKKFHPTSGISISISSITGKEPEIKIKGFGPEFRNIKKQISKPNQPVEAKITTPKITEEKAKKLSKLPKQEAETKVRRLSNKIIYEISLPEVKSIKDIIINKLENSIEIKAFSKNTVYFKLIPLNLPILKYNLKNQKLILELKPESN